MLVVLLVNLDIKAGLVNGSQGTIQGFEKYDPQNMPKASTNSRGGREREPDSIIGNVPSLAGDHAQFREEQIKEYIKHAGTRQWPIVQFLNGPKRTIYADCTVNELGDEKPHSLLSRTQVSPAIYLLQLRLTRKDSPHGSLGHHYPQISGTHSIKTTYQRLDLINLVSRA
jgi:ATP-dependent DNA helicase PIF1